MYVLSVKLEVYTDIYKIGTQFYNKIIHSMKLLLSILHDGFALVALIVTIYVPHTYIHTYIRAFLLSKNQSSKQV